MILAAQLRVLALCALAIPALAVPTPSPASSPPSCSGASCKQVLILGGGVAGVIAARKLTDEGITDFVIVEARDELGGRMHSTSFGARRERLLYEYEYVRSFTCIGLVAKLTATASAALDSDV